VEKLASSSGAYAPVLILTQPQKADRITPWRLSAHKCSCMEDQEAKVRKARLCRFFFLSHMCHGTLLIVSTLAEFLGDCYDRVGSQVQDWPTGGETSFTRIYDGDIIKINEDSHWSWNNTVHLCSRAHLPCSLNASSE